MRGRIIAWLVVILGSLAVVGVLGGTKAGQIIAMIEAGESMVPPPTSVTSTRVESVEWETSRSAIGTLVAVRGVTLGADSSGLVREIAFDSGASVARGAVLVKLDAAAEEAQVASAVAEASLARLELARARELHRAGASAPAELDAAEARSKKADASVAYLRAIVSKKTIRAPFDGRIAMRQVELGQVVAPGTPLATLRAVDPIHVDFWMPQQALAELREGQRVHLHTDTFPGETWEGRLATVNPEIDIATRNVRVRATVGNADGRLLPGMYVKVEVLAGENRHLLVIPGTAVLFAPYGDSVYTLEQGAGPDGSTAPVARQKFVRLGERRGDVVEVTSGLEVGEAVVSSGAFKLRNGAPVAVNNALAPDVQTAPRPED